jgi:hypothetical protein
MTTKQACLTWTSGPSKQLLITRNTGNLEGNVSKDFSSYSNDYNIFINADSCNNSEYDKAIFRPNHSQNIEKFAGLYELFRWMELLENDDLESD